VAAPSSHYNFNPAFTQKNTSASSPVDVLALLANVTPGTQIRPPLRPQRVPLARMSKAAPAAKERPATQSKARPHKKFQKSAAPKSPKKNQSGDYYTIQITSSRVKSTLINFAKQHNLPTKQVSIVSSTTSKPPHTVMFKLDYGRYPTEQAAQAALKTLPAQLQKTKPLIKKVHPSQTGAPA
jgi:DamX protein